MLMKKTIESLSNTELLKKIQELSEKFEKQKQVVINEYDKLNSIELQYSDLLKIIQERKGF